MGAAGHGESIYEDFRRRDADENYLPNSVLCVFRNYARIDADALATFVRDVVVRLRNCCKCRGSGNFSV